MLRNIILNDGNKIPMVGFGTYKATDGTGYEVVLDAIKAGYRLLDTAKVYENEEDVGRAIKKSGIPREEFFITSKLDRNMLGYKNAKFFMTSKIFASREYYCSTKVFQF